MADYFDRIITSAPVNSQTAKTMARGIHYEPKRKIVCAHWQAPPPVRPVPSDTPNLTGVRFGDFTVIGLSAEINRRWIVRCSCGDYETRTAKAIRNPINVGDRCHVCRNNDYLKQQDRIRQFGFDKADAMRAAERQKAGR